MAKIDCSDLARAITDLAMNISSEPGVRNLGDVVAEMKKVDPLITRELVINSIVEATEGQARQTDALIKQVNDIKAEARGDRRLQRKISSLERTLKAGETIQPKRRESKASQAIKDLRDIRDSLKKKISKSEPTQKKRLQAQIETLTKRIESGDILPATKPAVVPQSKELERLQFKRDELQRNIRRRIQALKPRSIFGRFVQDPFNAARNIITAYDFSGVFRQGGIFVIGRPLTAVKSLGPMFRSFKSKQVQDKVDKEIKADPNFPLRIKTGSFHAAIGSSYTLSPQEEIMQSKLIAPLEKVVPGLAGSNRAYITFLNKLRADMWNVLATSVSKDGNVTLEEAKAISFFVNVSTGRGSLGKFEQAAEAMNVAFFAPRYVASRFQSIILGVKALTPFVPFKGGKRVKRAIAKEYARYLVGMAAIYALAALTLDDEEFEWDPRSSDFGKIKIGKTRLDPMSGMSQVTVLLSRVISGEVKSSITGEISPIRGDDVGFGKRTTVGVVGSFLRYKLSPMFGTTLSLLAGEDPVGQPFGPEDLPRNLLIPLALREVFETIQEQGILRGTALSILAIFGMGIQTYGSTTQKKKKRTGFSK